MTRRNPQTAEQKARENARKAFDAAFDGLASDVAKFATAETARIIDAIVAAWNGALLRKTECFEYVSETGHFGGESGKERKTDVIDTFCRAHSILYRQITVALDKIKADKSIKLKGNAHMLVTLQGERAMRVDDASKALKNIRQQTAKLISMMAGLHAFPGVKAVGVNPKTQQIRIDYIDEGQENIALVNASDLAARSRDVRKEVREAAGLAADNGRGKDVNPAMAASLKQTAEAMLSQLAARNWSETQATDAERDVLSRLLAAMIGLADDGVIVEAEDADAKRFEEAEAKRDATRRANVEAGRKPDAKTGTHG